MANHLSSKKRIRQTEIRRVKNKYYARTARNAVKDLRDTTDKAQAAEMYPKVIAMLDKLAKTNIATINNKICMLLSFIIYCILGKKVI
jgi:small subunit ribosomal protein S20